MMFNKVVAAVATFVGASSMLVAGLPANITESAVATRAINPAGTHTGQSTLAWAPAAGGTNDEWVAAISHELYDNYPGYAGGNPNNNPVCGRTASITYGGKTITVGIVDRCEGCALWDVDLSPSAFQQFAPLASGRLYGATWHFN
ncbi:hypothetical protein CTheo_5131 [Ceratobasidium theobromae]|uniref:RlpA-like protein double-psi beta-barrel domain-containing protein n=1 Tax=Ceratobasidium theobromae TaxID=1582974 RepID=A0A5N5QID0_9AGAM|nr:hypothetical protein CTheo_5131 [Ceratobasidium theobromae]